MKNKLFSFVYNHLYILWAMVVVCSVSLLTGAITATILGTTAGIGIVTVMDRLIK